MIYEITIIGLSRSLLNDPPNVTSNLQGGTMEPGTTHSRCIAIAVIIAVVCPSVVLAVVTAQAQSRVGGIRQVLRIVVGNLTGLPVPVP